MAIVTNGQGDPARDRRVGGQPAVQQPWWRRGLLAVIGGDQRSPYRPPAPPPAPGDGHPGLPTDDLPVYRLAAWG